MRRFAALFQRLDQSTATGDKLAALVEYLSHAPPEDAAWAIWLLVGGKIGGAKARIASGNELRQWVSEETETPSWLVDASYHEVGDLAETLALLMPEPLEPPTEFGLGSWITERLAPVANADAPMRRDCIVDAWRRLPFAQRLVFNKLLTGALRVGVSHGLVQKALAQWSGVDVADIAQRLIGRWTPSAEFLAQVVSPDPQPGDGTRPYPFFLASALDGEPTQLGPIQNWMVEWKWDGIRVQLIRRGADAVLWSRGEERMDGRFPEVEAALHSLPRDAVIDGELLAWASEASGPLPFTALQTRIQRKKPSPRVLHDTPVRVLAYDVLELEGQDLRALPLSERRKHLESLLLQAAHPVLQVSPTLPSADWEDAARSRQHARERGVEGLMLKRRDSPYRLGRKRGDWWKWKIDPLTIDAVLLYAQAGHGRRSTLHTDYTFGVWNDGVLVPIAKAYSGLNDAEIQELDRWIRRNTTDRFGPVRAVTPSHVFELGFEGVNRSSRHKSGVAVRFPRILRWRKDKPAEDADRLETLQALAT